MALFSVIIPTFNRLEFLPATLASVRQQRFADHEVIVVDNGSTDGTADFLARQPSPPKVISLPQSGNGPGAARNAGAREAGGEYLAFLDSDDLWFPWTLDAFARLVAGHHHPAMLTAALQMFTHDHELSAISECEPAGAAWPDYLASSHRHCCAGAGTLVVRRGVFAASGGFDERPMNMEDHDLTLRLACERGFVAVERPVTLGWRRHPGSVSLDVTKSLAGARHLIRQELDGRYPGGSIRAQARRRVITAHVRPVGLECLRQGHSAGGWELYRRTFCWHLALGRWKYLLGFPVLALKAHH